MVCEAARFEGDRRDILLNPQVIIEVLSDFTESNDRGRKFVNYRTVPSIREYVLVAQDQVLVERYVRQADDQWLLTTFDDLESEVELETLSCRLAMRRIYRLVFERS